MGKNITEPFIIRVTLKDGRVLTGEKLFLKRTPDKPGDAETYALKAGNHAIVFTPQEVSLIEGGRL